MIIRNKHAKANYLSHFFVVYQFQYYMSKCLNCFLVIQHVGMIVVLNVNTWLILEVAVITLDK